MLPEVHSDMGQQFGDKLHLLAPKSKGKWAASSSACSVAMGLLWLRPQALTPLRPGLWVLQAPTSQGTPVPRAALLAEWGPRLALECGLHE